MWFSDIILLKDTTLLPRLRWIDVHTRGGLFELLTFFEPLWPHVVTTRFPAIEDVLEARRTAAIPLQAIYLRIAEEVALVRDGKILDTSCKDASEDVVSKSVSYLESVREVEIVSKDFEVFAEA